MVPAGMMKQAVLGLNDRLKEMGREVNAEEVAGIVETHALATAVGAAASGVIPGTGGLIAFGIATASTATMYARLARAMGANLHDGLLKAVASAVVSDLAASVLAALAASAAVSFIPGVGSLASSTLIALTNFGFVYLAGIIFIKMASSLGISKMEAMSEDELKRAAHEARQKTNVKDAMKEAKSVFKQSRNQ